MLTRGANSSGWLMAGNLIDDKFNQCTQTLVGGAECSPFGRRRLPRHPKRSGAFHETGARLGFDQASSQTF